MWRTVLIGLMLAGSLLAITVLSAVEVQHDSLCTVTTPLTALPELPEASGVTLSRRTPGLLWTHNDSSEPVLFALSTTGAVKGRVRVTGAESGDWEDVSAGPCPQGSCLYIADIGDNSRSRTRVRIYRVPEPRPDDGATRPAEVFEATYPDGAKDAEALFVTGADDLFFVTKAGHGSTTVYKWPTPLRTGSAPPLHLVARLPIERVTDADVSTDGTWVALRNNDEAVFYSARDLVAGMPGAARRFNLHALHEPQGEGITLGADGVVYVVGEGRAGTLAALRCHL